MENEQDFNNNLMDSSFGSQSFHQKPLSSSFTKSCVDNFGKLKARTLTQFDNALERLQVY